MQFQRSHCTDIWGWGALAVTALSLIDVSRRWLVATLKPLPCYREIARVQLERQGFQVFQPICREMAVKDGARRPVERPMFGRYVFIGLTTCQQSYPIAKTPGIQFLNTDGRKAPLTLKSEIVAALVARSIADGGAVDLCPKPKSGPLFPAGARVRIVAGPFEGHEALFAADEGDRCRVLFEIMGRQTAVRVSAATLEAA